MSAKYFTILSIAGSDSIGGAGIQADIKTATSLGVYAMTAVTAVTAQNTAGVAGYEPVGPRMLSLQLESILKDITPDAVKIGMIPDAESASIIADFLERYNCRNIVVDPVMVATSGHSLSSRDAIDTICNRLFPLASLVTPNIPEAERIAGFEIDCRNAALYAAQNIVSRFNCKAVLVKGGHSSQSETMTDILLTARDCNPCVKEFTHERIDTRNTHGTGCTLSSAIASFLALREPLTSAVVKGIDYLQEALAGGAGFSFGSSAGHGPVNHLIKRTIKFKL